MAGKVVKQLAGSGTGQSLSDLMTAMKYTLSGSVVVKIICKATTEEMCAPKRKHLAYLVQCTFEPRLSIPDFANQIVIRTQHSNLVVVFKALLTIHHLMQFGNERFSQYVASNNCHFYVPSLHDRNSVQAHGISLFLRPYAKYLDEKAASYREVAFDFCRLKRGKDDGDMRTMPHDKLMKTLPVIEKQLDALLLFDATLNELSNSLLRVAHLSLYRDLIRLYAVYNEGMINLIGRYFTMSKRDCRISLEIYKNFTKRMEAMNTFVRIAESAEPGGIPLTTDSENNYFKPVPPSVLEALEEHLVNLETHKQVEKKVTGGNTSPKSQTVNPLTSINTISPKYNNEDFESKFSTTFNNNNSSNEYNQSNKFVLSAAERRRIIEEERTRLEAFVSTARQHKFSDRNYTNTSDQNNYYSEKFDNDNFLDLLSFGELSTTKQSNDPLIVSNANKSNWLPIEQNSTLTSEHNLLDFNDISTNSSLPFSSNTTNLQLFPVETPSKSLVPVISPNQLSSKNPFLPDNFPQLPNTSEVFMSNQPVCSNLTSTSEQIQPNSNTIQSNSLISLDDKIAQIAENLSIRDHSYTSAQSGRIYRAPDGSLSAINWSGTMPFVQNSNVTSQQISQISSLRQSPSLNQIIGSFSTTNQQPVTSINGLNLPFSSTNPWAVLPFTNNQLFATTTTTTAITTISSMPISSNGTMNRSTNNNPFLL
ncbi:Phosphatidylinositol-binding clathrin assembly protein [Schistosoma japonicum]|uniref:Phosphatidylinositol-binding clathrin assembly protein n=2 Tax=Schistosoma japonicum TaxID=6182 RepID=A0A4Z2CPD8_SCHJA|nr:Phosphatidylinositol-binding clathrin assembly protein [Schistosoma japonicum]